MSKIDELLNDQDFMALDEDSQNQIIDEMRQKDFGSVPNTNNLLQNIIKSQRMGPFGGTSITAAVPTSREELTDLGKVGIRQVIPDESGMVGVGARMAGAKGDIRLPEPKTPYGKNLENSANIAQIAHLGGSAAKGIGSMVKGTFSPLRKFPIEQRIGNLGKQAEEASFAGSEAVKAAVPKKFESARKAYREMIDSVDVSNVTAEDLVKVLDDTILNKRISEKNIRRPAEDALLAMRRKFGSMIKEGTPDTVEELRDPMTNQVHRLITEQGTPKEVPNMSMVEELRNFKNQVFNSLRGETDLEAEFLNHYGKMLEDKGLGSISDVGKVYREAYALKRDSRAINRGALKRIATGKAGSSETKKLSDIEKRLGTSSVSEASKIGSQLGNEQNQLSLAMRNQQRVKALAGLSAVGGLVGGISKLFGGR